MGRYVYEHRGNGLIVDNIMKPLKGAISAAANKAGKAIAKPIGKRAGTAKAAVAEKSGDLIRRRLSKVGAPKTPRGRSQASNKAKMSNNEANTLINNLIARS